MFFYSPVLNWKIERWKLWFNLIWGFLHCRETHVVFERERERGRGREREREMRPNGEDILAGSWEYDRILMEVHYEDASDDAVQWYDGWCSDVMDAGSWQNSWQNSWEDHRRCTRWLPFGSNYYYHQYNQYYEGDNNCYSYFLSIIFIQRSF